MIATLPTLSRREETKRVRQVLASMSTLASGVKSDCCQSNVNTERGSVSVENSSPERETAGGFQEARGKKCITRASTECIQTIKDLHIRRRTLLKSKGEWVSTPENQDECRGQLCFTSFFSLRFPSTRRDNYRTNIRIATKLRSNDLHTKSDAETKVADVQHQEFGEKDFLVATLRESTGTSTKDEDVSKSQNDDTIYSWGNHVEHDISSHRPSDGIQRGLALCDQERILVQRPTLTAMSVHVLPEQ
ncbi:hypothetical protein PGIGA_G00136270 [Pangasianodon gigas]|uniref:Uncharacterized protein n=1 Tax=Pangasianodon gigas TaxID=30993 RepID=A0ACC5XKG0_PANGG|nr:hypothetical protein [Pangasianodon gigas]